MRYNTFNILTIGCQMNKSDSERFESYLRQKGMWPEDYTKADINIINTCGVRQSAEDRVYGLVEKIKKQNPDTKVVITGCLSKRSDVKQRLQDRVALFLPIAQMLNFDKFLQDQDQVLEEDFETKRQTQGEKYLSVLPKYEHNYTAYVPIGNGCNNFCAYCVVPYARGREVYRPKEEIIEEVKQLVKNNYKEIVLVAQNVNSYNHQGVSFADILQEVNDLEGDFWIRFASSHPKDLSDELIETIVNGEKVCRHLHLALQSGDDEILKLMNRKYTAQYYKDLIYKIRNLDPNIAITTDVIVGFPSETREQFHNTLEVFTELRFDMAYVAQYSPRPQTAAAQMTDDVDKQEKKRREEEIMKVLRHTAQENNEIYQDKDIRVLVDGKNKKGEFFGKSSSYKTVKFTDDTKSESDLKGKFAQVHIQEVSDFGLQGKLIKVYE